MVPDHFPRDSIVRRVNNEPAVALIGGRALVLQLCHPAVAHGVDDHSDFKSSPFKRLRSTAEAMFSIVNGSEELAAGVGARIHRIHDHIVGPSYAANRPENLMWVHATLVDSALLAYNAFVGHLSPEDTSGFYEGMKRVAEPLGLPRDEQPETYADFCRYFAETVDSLEPDATARDLISYVMRPSLPARLAVPLRPLLSVERLITIGFTPAPLREKLGMRWDPARQRRLDAWTLAIRAASTVQPRAVRTAPTRLGGELLMRQARRRLAA